MLIVIIEFDVSVCQVVGDEELNAYFRLQQVNVDILKKLDHPELSETCLVSRVILPHCYVRDWYG